MRNTVAMLPILAICASMSGAPQEQPDALPLDIVSASRNLNESENNQVRIFTTYWAGQLANGKLSEALEARDELIKTTQRPGTTGVFLRAYSQALLEGLNPIIESDDSMRAENAMRVAAFIRTPRMATLIVEQVDPTVVSDPYRRLVAAGLVQVVVADVNESGLNSATLTSLARDIAAAATKEDNWHTVLQELRALGVIVNSSQLSGPNRNTVRELQFKTFLDIVDRAGESSKPSPLINALYRSLLDLRMRMIANDAEVNEKTREAAELLHEAIGRIGKVALRQWSDLSSDRTARQEYEGVLRVGSQLLSLLGKPDSQAAALAKAMQDSKAEFQRALQAYNGG
ncbi:MAG: hypothetical protein MK085_04880 [Phycisphaerales bacterium]|nr:hypothetical protein [Phycisphaerales bacterium]